MNVSRGAAAVVEVTSSLSMLAGIRFTLFINPDAQDGKSLVDRLFAVAKCHVRRYLAAEHDVATEEQLVEALRSHGGLTGHFASLVRIDRSKACAFVVPKLPAKQKVVAPKKWSVVEYLIGGNVKVWRQWGIGEGKVYTAEHWDKLQTRRNWEGCSTGVTCTDEDPNASRGTASSFMGVPGATERLGRRRAQRGGLRKTRRKAARHNRNWVCDWIVSAATGKTHREFYEIRTV